MQLYEFINKEIEMAIVKHYSLAVKIDYLLFINTNSYYIINIDSAAHKQSYACRTHTTVCMPYAVSHTTIIYWM